MDFLIPLIPLSYTNKSNIIINNENDYYSDDYNKGFYFSIFISNFIIPLIILNLLLILILYKYFSKFSLF